MLAGIHEYTDKYMQICLTLTLIQAPAALGIKGLKGNATTYNGVYGQRAKDEHGCWQYQNELDPSKWLQDDRGQPVPSATAACGVGKCAAPELGTVERSSKRM